MIHTNSAGIQIIKDSETLELKAYKCPAGVWTIGWGTTRYPDAKPVKKGDTCTREQADAWLLEGIKDAENIINRYVKVPLTLNQFSALVSFTYNIGETQFSKSTILAKINVRPADPDVALELAKWRKGGGKILTGLIIRRAKETILYFTR